jgi:flavin-dependent dehydrogenase
LYAAYRLGRAGVPVRVYDARGELDYEKRTLIVTPAWIDLLDFDVSEAVLNHTEKFELISQSESTRVSLGEPDVILERARFMRLLARQARQAGAQLLLDHRFEGLQDDDRFPLLRFRNGHGPELHDASTVIGADGVDSSVAEAVDRDDVEHVSIVQARVRMPEDLAADTVRIWFNRESTRFFVWLIPESEEMGALGLIADSEENAERVLDAYLLMLNVDAMEIQKAWVPMYGVGVRASASLGDGQALLVGDAAGQVKVTTVGGVVTGMLGGAAAARSILRGTAYSTEARSLRWELRAHAALRHVLDGFTDEDYDRLLSLLNGRTRQVLRRHNRDELRRSIWRLVVAQPRWLSLGTRAFLQRILGCPSQEATGL